MLGEELTHAADASDCDLEVCGGRHDAGWYLLYRVPCLSQKLKACDIQFIFA